jgi:NACHT domain-containing protein
MEGKIIETLATEALKPVSSFIDALLQPKLQRIRINAKKRELKDRLGDKIVNELLEQYFKRLLRRVSGITTIVFPQQQLALSSIYEPMRLNQMIAEDFKLRGTEKTVSLSVTDLKAGENYLIVDSAGMGKSTFAKYLVLDIFSSEVKIPIFLELRRIEESETLLGKISKEIDEHQEDIDERFLGMLFEQGHYIIILDGYDELSENARGKIGAQITELALKYDQNTVILTSRPEVSLPEISSSTVFSIQPLNRKQAESLVLRYDAVASLDVGKGLIQQFDAVSREFLEIPLLVILLYRTYGYNQSIATKVTSFYDDVFNAYYKGHDLSKSGFSRPKLSGLDFEEFRRLLRGFAFLLSVQQKNNISSRTEAHSIIEDSIKLTSTKPTSAPAFFDDLLSSVPLLLKEGNEFRFIHKSICDFFTGEFLAFSQDAEGIIRKIQAGNLSRSFIKPFEFLAELNPSLFRRSIVAPIAARLIDERNPIPDTVLRTIWFFLKISIGLKTDDKIDSEAFFMFKDFRLFLNPYTMHANLLSKGRRLRFAQSGDKVMIPWAAWKLLSKETESMFEFITHNLPSETIIPLEDFLEPGVMYPLNSDIIVDHANHPALRGHLLALLQSIPPQGDKRQSRVIDLDACQNVLVTIREEAETQGWIDDLLDG